MKRRRRVHELTPPAEWRSVRFGKPRADDLLTLTWGELCSLEDRGLITRAEVARIVAEQVKAANGGVDPYQHLYDEYQHRYEERDAIPEREYRPRPPRIRP